MPQLENEVFSAVTTVSLVLFLLLLVVVVVIINYKRKQKNHLREKVVMQEAFTQQLLRSQVEVQESTYRHIAAELHDNVGQLLSTTKMLIGITEIKLDNVPDTLLTANATLSKAIQEIRSISRSLDKEWLQQFNFLENLKTEIDRINAGEVIRASMHSSVVMQMKPEEQIILFRIVQEAIQNAIRHAFPTQVNVTIAEDSEQLQVQVSNDGAPLPAGFHGMGTNNMRHRARLFGGTVQWRGLEDKTIVTISIPLKENHEN